MTIAYVDCFHGAAGDMLLASLLDAGLAQAELERVLAALPLSGYRIVHTRVQSHGISGSRVEVAVDGEQPPRDWRAIRTMLHSSALPERTRHWALGAFERLARVEAAIHGTTIEEVHFHEVGAVDSIVDIVGFCAGLELLGVAQVYASALPTGSGWVPTQHGPLPVPAPATLALLAEVRAPLLPGPSRGELLTPTAAALLAELARFEQPPMRLEQVGYGLGRKQFARLNGLRVWLGQTLSDEPGILTTHAHSHEQSHNHDHAALPQTSSSLEQVIELRCNLDDATGELVGYAIERLLAAGALDAWAAPLTMKKGRPGIQLGCLARVEHVETLAALLLRETPTLGVRWEAMQRIAAGRDHVHTTTPWGTVRVKRKLLDGQVVGAAPEYEDCAALARAHNIPLNDVYVAALTGLLYKC